MERLALKFTNYINKYGYRTELELKKIKYGIEVILINLSKFIILMVISYFFKIMPHTLLIMVSFGLVRKSAFGLHSQNSIICTLICVLSFSGGVYISKYYPLETKSIVYIFVVMITLFMKYAPADTKRRPLIGRKFRNKLKRKTLITTLLLFAIILKINNQTINTLITLGVVMECICILPITYKILGRRYNNYEQYE